MKKLMMALALAGATTCFAQEPAAPEAKPTAPARKRCSRSSTVSPLRSSPPTSSTILPASIMIVRLPNSSA